MSLKYLNETISKLTPHKIDKNFLSSKGVEGISLRNQEIECEWKRPTSMQIIGSYLLRTVCKPVLNVDVGVVIPKSCFQKKDVRDFRYHDKRNLYLGYIASAIKEDSQFNEFNFSTFREDRNKVILTFKITKCNQNSLVLHYHKLIELPFLTKPS